MPSDTAAISQNPASRALPLTHAQAAAFARRLGNEQDAEWSVLGGLAARGEITAKTAQALRECVGEAGPEQRAEIEALIAYVERCGERDYLPGWTRCRHEGVTRCSTHRATTLCDEGEGTKAVALEVAVASSLGALGPVGLSASARSTRERIQTAIVSAGFARPVGRLSARALDWQGQTPGSEADLALACALLAASGQIDGAGLETHALIGELSLDGRVLSCNVAVTALAAARAAGVKAIVLAVEDCERLEAGDGLTLIGVRDLAAAVAALGVSPAAGGPPFGEEQVSAALNGALEDIRAAAQLDDTGTLDALNLLANATLERLRDPGVTLAQVALACYQQPLATLLEWICER
jgi:Subunit ChlI of Mg-chelatase